MVNVALFSGAIAVDLQTQSATSELLHSISCTGNEDMLVNCSYQTMKKSYLAQMLELSAKVNNYYLTTIV